MAAGAPGHVASALKTQKAPNACTQLALSCVFSEVPLLSVGLPFSVNLIWINRHRGLPRGLLS